MLTVVVMPTPSALGLHILYLSALLQSLRDRLSLSVLEDGSRKAERLENFLVTSNSTVQKFLYWDFLANILPSRFLLPMPTVTTYRATTVTAPRRDAEPGTWLFLFRTCSVGEARCVARRAGGVRKRRKIESNRFLRLLQRPILPQKQS